jgi:protein SCO1/2
MRIRTLGFAFLLALPALPVATQDFLSAEGPTSSLKIEQKIGKQLPLDLKFRNEKGDQVTLGDYFKDERPVVISLVYYNCPMLCNMVLDGVTNAIANLKYEIGSDYQVVTISFDHRDTPEMAAQKKSIYARRYGRPGTDEGWAYLVADEPTVREITAALGFRYAYDPERDEFAHGTLTTVVTPQGTIARYFFGIEYSSFDLRLALLEASKGKVGSPVEQLLLLCYHYDPATGRYAKAAMNFVRAGGFVTVLGIAWLIMFLNKRPSGEGETQG